MRCGHPHSHQQVPFALRRIARPDKAYLLDRVAESGGGFMRKPAAVIVVVVIVDGGLEEFRLTTPPPRQLSN